MIADEGFRAMPLWAEMRKMENGEFTYEEVSDAVSGSALDLDVSFACVDGKVITHIECASPEKPKEPVPKTVIGKIEWV